MHIRELSGKRICILGFGKEGKACLAALQAAKIDADITIADAKESMLSDLQATSYPFDKLRAGKLQTGPSYLSDLSSFDLIIKSPGIPPSPELDAIRDKITSGTQIFLDTIRDSGAFVIGVTGSKGKSTTSTLIYEMLKAAGKDVHLIGNIGKPAIEYIDRAKPETIFVEELSSYQLMDLTVSPSIAVITSFFPEHLDYHGSLEAYLEAKKHITRFQGPEDIAFFCATSPGAVEIAKEGGGRKIHFSADDAPVPIEDTHLLGAHNLSNIAAAFLVARELGVSEKTAIEVSRNFRGLPHRLQSLGVHHGIEWVDDAISTTPESTIAALDALGDRVKTIILGGQDRGNDFTSLAERIMKSSIETIILFPGSGPRIREALRAEAGARTMEIVDAATMEEVVNVAKRETPKNAFAIALLSTASPSYNMFKNFEEKGETFRKCIEE